MRGGVWEMSSTCVQGGLPSSIVNYQNMMEAQSSAPAAWGHMHSLVNKQEPMKEDRNDSGLISGSDFQSSSPGSDNSRDGNVAYTAPAVPSQQTSYYGTPSTTQYSRLLYATSSPYHLGFSPLTPPSSEPMVSPKAPKLEAEQNTTLTPHASPTLQESKTPCAESEQKDDNPLRRLQLTFEKNDFLPSALSPKTTSQHSNDDDSKSDPGTEEGDEENLRTPKVNSHGKVKTFKCKQCDFVAITKLDFWEHSKMHIKTDKLLTCPKCPFVTEYKHHLEYHLHNHFGSKPFKCDKCDYSCINKSMLNSHMKSHSNIYQYRCSDCSYATKYCHSLKVHLRKYNHKPAMVLNPDGTPNPQPIIDLYGTRRRPKMKSQQQKEEEEILTQNHFAQLMNMNNQQLPMNFPYGFMQGFPSPLGNPLFFPQLAQLAQERQMQYQEQEQETEQPSSPPPDDSGALDLTKSEGVAEPPTKHRRKGRAFKLDRSIIDTQQSDDEDIPVTVRDQTFTNNPQPPVKETKEEGNQNDFCCHFCRISFGDLILYTMHMGYHGYRDPFTCNMCGEQCSDKVAFFLHIARNPHTLS